MCTFNLLGLAANSPNEMPALAMTWLVLVLPATFAEVIGLSLKTSGRNAYLNVQLFTGFMYTGAFVFGISYPLLSIHHI